MNRRRFLTLAGSTVFLAGVPSAALLTRRRRRLELLASPVLLELLGEAEEVRRIGAAYRAAVPEEDDVDALADAVLRASGPAAYLPDRFLVRRLEEQPGRDFDRDDVVELDGWVLSRTEARQSALFSILHP